MRRSKPAWRIDTQQRATLHHSKTANRLQFELAVIQTQIKRLKDVERRLADTLKAWDQSPHTAPIQLSINRLIDTSSAH